MRMSLNVSILVIFVFMSGSNAMHARSDNEDSIDERLISLEENSKIIMGQNSILIVVGIVSTLSFWCFLCFQRHGYIQGPTQANTPQSRSGFHGRGASFELRQLTSSRGRGAAGSGWESV